MVQESKSKVAIIGGGPAGCICAYFLQNNFDVTVFDKKSPLSTLLPTGGGRCNLAHAEFDFKELAKNYPRGEKFLYSVFSKFSTADTLDFFKEIGVDTYTQENGRIFPVSNSSKDVRERFLKALNKVRFVKEEVLKIEGWRYGGMEVWQLPEEQRTGGQEGKLKSAPTLPSPMGRVPERQEGVEIITNKTSNNADYVVIATGGHASFELIQLLGHKIIPPKPSLTGLKTKEDFSSIAGVAINDVLLTHKGVSGPKIYEISSINARKDFPYKLSFDFVGEIDLQTALNSNPHKSIKNLLSEYVVKSFAEYILKDLGISADMKCHEINGKIRDKILNKLQNFEITVVGTVPDGEVVMAGGVDLKEVNPKTLESKLHKNIYFCGEVLDIDGFCGGFNLQNCWSTGYVVAKSLSDNDLLSCKIVL